MISATTRTSISRQCAGPSARILGRDDLDSPPRWRAARRRCAEAAHRPRRTTPRDDQPHAEHHVPAHRHPGETVMHRPPHQEHGRCMHTPAVTATQPSTNAHSACRSDNVLLRPVIATNTPCRTSYRAEGGFPMGYRLSRRLEPDRLPAARCERDRQHVALLHLARFDHDRVALVGAIVGVIAVAVDLRGVGLAR